MNIHEYQAKTLLRDFGVAVLEGQPAFTVEEAVAAAEALGGPLWVVKSQIHAGGRGAGQFKDGDGQGGVRLCKSLEAMREAAQAMLGQVLITKQTGPEGKRVQRLYVEDGCQIQRELYLSMLIDRGRGQVMIMVSAEGGMDIETLAVEAPEKLLKVTIDPTTGFQPHHGRRIAFFLGLTGGAHKSCVQFLKAIYGAFVALDASLVEINPLVITTDDTMLALDAKMNFDDNALFRQSAVAAMRDETEENPSEQEAADFGLNYIRLAGSIGCMVNGAGLAMATMDIIQLKGGAPANFLDVGGGANREQVTKALEIILSDPHVRVVLVNIFGGIMRCDIIADGIIAAAREMAIEVPLVVRLEGTNVEKGREIMDSSGLAIITADSLEQAAEKAVQALEAGV